MSLTHFDQPEKISTLFIELYVRDINYNIEIFSKILGFQVVRNEGDFAELCSDSVMLLLNDGSDLEHGHPFRSRLDFTRNGTGVEIGFYTSELSVAYSRASEFQELKVSEIKLQNWGLRDFRIITPDNYYIRITEYSS